jgi:hypothetical protein
LNVAYFPNDIHDPSLIAAVTNLLEGQDPPPLELPNVEAINKREVKQIHELRAAISCGGDNARIDEIASYEVTQYIFDGTSYLIGSFSYGPGRRFRGWVSYELLASSTVEYYIAQGDVYNGPENVTNPEAGSRIVGRGRGRGASCMRLQSFASSKMNAYLEFLLNGVGARSSPVESEIRLTLCCGDQFVRVEFGASSYPIHRAYDLPRRKPERWRYFADKEATHASEFLTQGKSGFKDWTGGRWEVIME